MSTTRPDWRKPLRGMAEETYWTEPSEDGSGDQPRRSIRWLVDDEGLGRIERLEACPFCLTGFPAPPRPDTWSIWKTSDFGWLHSLADSKALVRQGRCPICKSEISSEMLAIQVDQEWADEDAKLQKAKLDNLDDEREREEHAENKQIERLGLLDPVAPPSKRKSAKRRGET